MKKAFFNSDALHQHGSIVFFPRKAVNNPSHPLWSPRKSRSLLRWAPLFLLSGLLLSHCGEDPGEKIGQVRTLLLAKEPKKARKKIKEILLRENRENAELLSDENKSRHYVQSLNGSTVAWLEEGLLYYYKKESQQGSLEVPSFNGNLQLSIDGEYALFSYEKEKECRVYLYHLGEDRTRASGSLPFPSCKGSAILPSPDGERLYFMDGAALKEAQIDPILQSIGSARVLLDQGEFKPKYKGIQNTFHLHYLPGDTILIFYGAAGYYSLHQYSIKESRLYSIGTEFATPNLYLSYPEGPDFFLSGKNEEEAPVRSPKAIVLLKGSAGKFTLHPLRLTLPIEVEGGIPFSPTRNFYYLKNSGAVLNLKEKLLSIGEVGGKTVDYFPLYARKFIYFNGGLLYETPEGELYFRKAPPSPLETELMGYFRESLR